MSTEEEYDRLLKQFPEKLQGALTWKKYFERLVQAGRRTGRTDIQIGDDIRKELRGQLDDRTIRYYLPASFKHEEKIRPQFAEKFAANNNQPDIPPPPQVIQEVETEPPKPIDEPIHIPEHQITLNCRKFGTEIRMGLLNNAILKLRIDKLNQVISIG